MWVSVCVCVRACVGLFFVAIFVGQTFRFQIGRVGWACKLCNLQFFEFKLAVQDSSASMHVQHGHI